MQKIQNYIGGEFLAPAEGRYLPNENPALGEVYSEVPDSSATDINHAVEAAEQAFPAWSNLPAEARAQVLRRIAEEIERNALDLARAESIDQGKTLKQAFDLEIPRAARNFRYFASLIEQKTEMAASAADGQIYYTRRDPIGVAGLISPWNLPLYLITWKIAPAIAAGNTVVCKPSELTPMTAFLLGNLLNHAGLPSGVCNIVHGRGAIAGEALVVHPKVPIISFTGGTATGQRIIECTAPGIKRLSLELGGKNAAVVFADADMEKCITGTVRAGFANQGEICLCASRVYVEESAFTEFVQRYTKIARLMRVGDPLAEKVGMGALVSKAHREKVISYIELAEREGATILLDGRKLELPAPHNRGYFLGPTIITGVKQNSKLTQEEIFGPVVCLYSFKDEQEALKLANDTTYGLSASVWTENLGKAQRMAKGLNVGTVWVNTWMQRDLRVPFGGAKRSGLGREGGEDSLDFYSETKTICLA